MHAEVNRGNTPVTYAGKRFGMCHEDPFYSLSSKGVIPRANIISNSLAKELLKYVGLVMVLLK